MYVKDELLLHYVTNQINILSKWKKKNLTYEREYMYTSLFTTDIIITMGY